MTTNLTKRINESICAVGIPVLRRHRAQVTKRPWKRALSSASLCASLTIEAALSLTLFMFTVILLSVPMEILDTQRKVQTVLEVTGRELGWQVYRTSHTVHPAEMEAGKEAEAGEKGTGGWSELPSGLILQGYLKEKIQTAGGTKCPNIQCGRQPRIGRWRMDLTLRASYQVRLPFSVFALDHVTLTSRSRERGMDWGGRRVFLREKRFRTGEENGSMWGGTICATISRLRAIIYGIPDHRGCVCRCHFRGCLETAGDAVIRLADTVERRCRREVWCIFFRPARFTMESRTVRHWHIMCRRCGDQRWNIWVCVHTVEVDRCGWRKRSRRGERAE